MYVLSGLTQRTVASSKGVTVQEWARIRDVAYPGWRDAEGDEWPEPNAHYMSLIARLAQQYEETENGQLRMFDDPILAAAEALGGVVEG